MIPRSKVEIEAMKHFGILHENIGKYQGFVFEGSSRSAKTRDICLFICGYLRCNTGKTIVIGRDTLANLRDTLLLDFKWALKQFKINTKIGSANPSFKYRGNSVIFIGLNDDPMKTEGMGSDIFWINEAIGTFKECHDNLEQRCREFWIVDYNPKLEVSWAYGLELRADVLWTHSTFWDNIKCPELARKKILSYDPSNPRNVEQGTADKYRWEVYGLGKRTAGDLLVYPEWYYFEDKPKMGEEDYKVFSLDWGYSNDPTAILEQVFIGNSVYKTELLYETGLTNPEIAEKFKSLISKEDLENCYLVCDSAEPKSIDELVLLGINAVACYKGQGSINEGIKEVKKKRQFVNVKSENLIFEKQNYKFKKLKTGERSKLPIDKHNHLMDAERYGATFYT